jgi:RHS repeat-associated protein
VLELDENASIICYEEYYPYGETSYRAGRNIAEVGLKRYRYTGKEKDEESGLYYYGARYYACWLGRWTAVDPAGLVDGVNLYMYCRGSPIILLDKDGRQPSQNAGYIGAEPENPLPLEWPNNPERFNADNMPIADSKVFGPEEIKSVEIDSKRIDTIKKYGWGAEEIRNCNKLAYKGVREAVGADAKSIGDKLPRLGYDKKEELPLPKDPKEVAKEERQALADAVWNLKPDVEINKNMVDYAKSAIDSNLPVIIGVSTAEGPVRGGKVLNDDYMTNHFLVLVGYSMTDDGEIVSFKGVDNRSSKASFVYFNVDKETKEIIKHDTYDSRGTGISEIDEIGYRTTQMRLWKQIPILNDNGLIKGKP